MNNIKGNKENKKENKIKGRDFIIAIFCALIISNFLTSKVFFLGKVPSSSMEPTLSIGDKVIITRNVKEVKKGEIYTFEKEGKLMVKRCIATGGDTVQIRKDMVYVNGELLKEEYVSSKEMEPINIDITIPNDNYFFLGDNRVDSYDARYWTNPCVSKEDIRGKVQFIIYPINRIMKVV